MDTPGKPAEENKLETSFRIFRVLGYNEKSYSADIEYFKVDKSNNDNTITWFGKDADCTSKNPKLRSKVSKNYDKNVSLCNSAILIPEKDLKFPLSNNNKDTDRMIAVWFSMDRVPVARYFTEIEKIKEFNNQTKKNEMLYSIKAIEEQSPMLYFVKDNGIQHSVFNPNMNRKGGKRVRPRKSRQSRKPRKSHNKKTRKHSRK